MYLLYHVVLLFLDIVLYTLVLLQSVIARIFFLFFLLCIYMSCNNIVITMGGQLR